jgi:hypothetical protein
LVTVRTGGFLARDDGVLGVLGAGVLGVAGVLRFFPTAQVISTPEKRYIVQQYQNFNIEGVATADILLH